jgi:hypothetical protein
MRAFAEFDLVSSAAIFVTFLVLVSMSFSDNFSKYKTAVDGDVMEAHTRSAVNFMIFSPGQPTNWNENVSSMQEFGLSYYFELSSHPLLLDYKKINASLSIPYSELKQMTDAKDIRIVIHDIDLNRDYVLGANSSMRNHLTSVERFSAIRYSLSNVTKAKVTVMIWD